MAQNQPSSTSDLIHALMMEYDACYKTRDHYETVQYTLGSILLTGVLIILGGSFQIKIQTITDRLGVLFIGTVSIVLVVIWFVYIHHVQPIINDSIRRALDIETLVNYYCGGQRWLQLQTILHSHEHGTGKAITGSLFVLMLAAAIVRVILALL